MGDFRRKQPTYNTIRKRCRHCGEITQQIDYAEYTVCRQCKQHN